MIRAVPILALGLALASPLAAQTHGGHGGHGAAQSPATAPSTIAEVNARMHRAMDIPPSGNPDVDFVRAMIPHHEGAIDMARLVLAQGSDPDVRALAQAIIDAQDKEIAWMRDWLARTGN